MALVPAAEINAAIDNAAQLNRPKVVKQMVHGSSTAVLYIEAGQAFAGNAGWIYVATAAATADAASSVSAACAVRI